MILDLTYGHPLFLEPYWEAMSRESLAKLEMEPHHGIAYGKEGGEDSLVEAIRSIHCQVGNADAWADHTVVVGNGASQILHAALQALSTERVYARRPYFFRFPIQTEMAGRDWACDPRFADTELVTLPSNPDNELYEPHPHPKIKIHDLCYNWPQYTSVVNYDADVMVFSLAKAIGHAGSRIGWAICKNPDHARAISHQVELLSGGVSIEAQARARLLLSQQANLLVLMRYGAQGDSVFSFGKKELESRWQALLALSHPKLKILNRSGMFAWCEYDSENPYSELLKDYKIKATYGGICGGGEKTLRLNVGCRRDSFDELIRRLSG